MSPEGALAARMADAVMARRPAEQVRWSWEEAALVEAVDRAGRADGDPARRSYAARAIGRLVDEEGQVEGWRGGGDLRGFSPGCILASLLADTGEERYRRALRQLLGHLRRQPRTRAGGFWSSRSRPSQIWIDTLAAPFHALCASALEDQEALDDAAHQLLLADETTRDPRSGLPCHAWDESRRQLWSNPESGRSPVAWARAVGSFAAAAVDTLAVLPAGHRARKALTDLVAALCRSAERWQHPASGVWYQVMDQPDREGNYPEPTGSCLLVRALAAAGRLCCLPSAVVVARRGWTGILSMFVREDAEGLPVLRGCTPSVDLGGTPYRDGSFSCYTAARAVDNEPAGVAAFIAAAVAIGDPVPV